MERVWPAVVIVAAGVVVAAGLLAAVTVATGALARGLMDFLQQLYGKEEGLEELRQTAPPSKRSGKAQAA